jgi:hypothetical protein
MQVRQRWDLGAALRGRDQVVDLTTPSDIYAIASDSGVTSAEDALVEGERYDDSPPAPGTWPERQAG